MFMVLVLAVLLPGIALAHTRWFAAGEILPYVSDEPTALYLGAWALVAFAIVTTGIYLERRGLMQLSLLHPRRDHAYPRAASTFSMIAGAFFLIAGTHGYLFSPNLTIESGIPYTLVVLQILIGVAFLAGVYARVAALGLALLWLASIPLAGVIAILEDVWVLSTALFVLIMGSDYFSLVPWRAFAHLTRRYHEYALPLLRLGTGATLLVLGFSEKILRPELGINFLAQHDWNFMQLLGFEWYSDYLFVLSAGAVESLLGLIFILGVVTRLNALVLAIFFTIPMFILGPIELAGHLPHFAAVVLLLLFGGGNRLKISQKLRAHRRRTALSAGAG
ncbi:DoxX family membrane protein [Candidatus Kaiserbacteria bacterium]|nr:DoxX family membrane protein [Candidatus Kaiserbacteria bacterium]